MQYNADISSDQVLKEDVIKAGGRLIKSFAGVLYRREMILFDARWTFLHYPTTISSCIQPVNTALYNLA